MRDIINCVSVFSQLPMVQQQSASMTTSQMKGSCETQTEIIAVHTPQIEHQRDFPFVVQKAQRPSSLPINSSSNDSSVRSSQNNTATTGDDEMEQKNVDEAINTSAN